MFDDLVDCKRILRETAIMTRKVCAGAADCKPPRSRMDAGSPTHTLCRSMTSSSLMAAVDNVSLLVEDDFAAQE